MDQGKQSWLEKRGPRERRYDVARQIGKLARAVVPDCIVADETPGNLLPIEINFGVEIYNVPLDKRIAVHQAVSRYTFGLLRNERLMVHVHISTDNPPAKATIIVGMPSATVAESKAKYGN